MTLWRLSSYLRGGKETFVYSGGESNSLSFPFLLGIVKRLSRVVGYLEQRQFRCFCLLRNPLHGVRGHIHLVSPLGGLRQWKPTGNPPNGKCESMATDIPQDRLGDLFVREGLITADELKQALREAQQSKTRIGYALVKLGLVAEDELTRALAKQFRVPAVDLEKVQVEEKILRLVPEQVAMKHRVLPLEEGGAGR